VPILPQVSVPFVRLLYKFWVDHKVPADVLDEILGMDLERENGKKFGISSEKLVRLHEAAAKASSDEFIGVRLGKYLGEVEPTLGNILKSAATLEDGLQAMQTYAEVISENGRYEILSHETTTEVRYIHFDEVPFTQYQYDMIYTGLIACVANVYPDECKKMIFIVDKKVAHSSIYKDLMPCAIEAGNSRGFFIPNDLLTRPNPKQNAALFEQCIKDAQKVIRKRKARLELYSQVRLAIQKCLLAKGASQEDVAAQLKMSVRNLQRRLKEAGTSYQSILDDSREELALKLIADESVPLYEIAFLVGYTEPSAFYKAFKRWTGKRPGDYREGVLDTQSISVASGAV